MLVNLLTEIRLPSVGVSGSDRGLACLLLAHVLAELSAGLWQSFHHVWANSVFAGWLLQMTPESVLVCKGSL